MYTANILEEGDIVFVYHNGDCVFKGTVAECYINEDHQNFIFESEKHESYMNGQYNLMTGEINEGRIYYRNPKNITHVSVMFDKNRSSRDNGRTVAFNDIDVVKYGEPVYMDMCM